MTFEDFIKLAGDSVTMNSDPPTFGEYYYGAKQKVKDTPYLVATWSTGGMSGGNCWNEGGHYATGGETPAELTALDDLLEEIKQDIGLRQYKALCSVVVHSDTYSQSEYYGNYSDYAVKYVKLSELYDYIKTKGWI